MTGITGLVCTQCGRRYAADERRGTCADHEGTTGLLDVEYDEDTVARVLTGDVDPAAAGSLWQYEPILPTSGERVSLDAGGTPMLSAPALGETLDVELFVKDETANPTGSMKDRASAVMVSRAVATQSTVACASTGNAAASLAAYAARAGLEARIFVPSDVPDGKGIQPLIHGATVTTVDGTYEDAFDRCRTRSSADGWLDCSAAVNPYGLEGLRTAGFEIAQSTSRTPPDWVVVPMGNGCALAGVWKGLAAAFRHGVIDSAPRMLGVQAAGTCPIHERFTSDRSSGAGTAADSIDVDVPHNAARACRALEESGGRSVVATDDDILTAEGELARTEGLYVEPASAAALAGLRRARNGGIVDAGETVALVLTGTGLKDTDSARRVVEEYGE